MPSTTSARCGGAMRWIRKATNRPPPSARVCASRWRRAMRALSCSPNRPHTMCRPRVTTCASSAAYPSDFDETGSSGEHGDERDEYTQHQRGEARGLSAEQIGLRHHGRAAARARGAGLAARRTGDERRGAHRAVHRSRHLEHHAIHRARSDRWKGFDIEVKETVNFTQAKPDYVILNRVNGGSASSILGKLSADGRVFLINPNGIVFGPNSQANVAGLIATTANISNKDFMAGQMTFAEPGKATARIVNRGQITAANGGLVALVAPGVENAGDIQTNLGKVTLASGNVFILDMFGDGLVGGAGGGGGAGGRAGAGGRPGRAGGQ